MSATGSINEADGSESRSMPVDADAEQLRRSVCNRLHRLMSFLLSVLFSAVSAEPEVSVFTGATTDC